MKKVYSTIIRAGIGITILAIIIKKVGLKEIMHTVGSMDKVWVIAAFALYGIGVWLGSTNVWLLIRAIGNKLSYGKLFKDYMHAWSLGLFLPGKVGDVSIIYFLKKDGIPLGEAAAISIADKFTTATTLFFFAIFGFFRFLSFPNAIKIIAAISAIIICILFILMSNFTRSLIKKFILKSYAKKFAGFSKTFISFFTTRLKALLYNYGITIIKWMMTFLMVYLLYLGTGNHVSFLIIMIVYATVLLISAIPLTPSGIGIKEVSAVYLFGLAGVPAPVVLSVSIVGTLFNYLTATMAMLLIKR